MGAERSNGPWRPYPILEAIAQKCATFSIETELDLTREGTPGERATLWIAFPEYAGPDGSPEYINYIEDGPGANFALAAPFEQYAVFRGGPRNQYGAIWSQTLGAVECELVPCDRPVGAPTFGREHDESVERVLEALGHESIRARPTTPTSGCASSLATARRSPSGLPRMPG